MKIINRVLRWILMVALAGIFLNGCARSVRIEQFYTLSAMDRLAGAEVPAGRRHGVIGIGPVRLPDAIDRPQIVTRTSPNRLNISEYHRWAGALDGEIARVLAENLACLLGTDAVVCFPQETYDAPTLRVELEIRRFDGRPGQEATLDVSWTIVARSPATVLHRQQSRLRETVSQDGYESLVAAQSRLLAALSRKIATAIDRVDPVAVTP